MNELLTALSVWLADFLTLATVLLTVSAVAMWRLKGPSQRMAVAWGTMAGLTALVAVTLLPAWPRWDVRHWFSASLEEPALIEKPVVTYHEGLEGLVPRADEDPPRPVAKPAVLPALPLAKAKTSIHWPVAAALAWLTFAAGTVGWIALGAVQAWRLLWTANQSPLWAQTELARLIGRHRKPRLKTSSRIGSAVALGTWRPAILLPMDHVREDNRAGVQAALAHEWAHIRHGDLWLLAWQRLLVPLLALHPLFWLLRRQVRADQELLADMAAAGEKPVEYAEALLAWAKLAGPRGSAPLAALAMWENPQTVSRRIQMLLDPKKPVARKRSRLCQCAVVLSLAAVVGGLSLVSFRSRPVAAQEPDLQSQPAPATSDAQPLPPTAQVQQVELSVALIRLGKEDQELTSESIRELAQRFGDNDNFVFDGGVCVVALPREQVATAIKLLRESDQAKILAAPKLMTVSGRDAVLSDGGEMPRIETQETADGKRIETVEYHSLRTLRVRPEVHQPKESVVRLAVTRENSVPIDELDPHSDTEQTRPRMITRQLSFTADVPIGRTLLVWELKPPAADAANLILITPEGIHAVTRQVLANPQPLALDFAFPTAWPAPSASAADPRAAAQLRLALDKLLAEAESNLKLRADMQQESARLHQRISDLMAHVQWLRSVANQAAQDQVTDADFIRRVYLDLFGVLPQPDEVKAFLDSGDGSKRTKLVDKLLADPKVADHWATMWKDLIAARQPESADAAPPTNPLASSSELRSADSAPPVASDYSGHDMATRRQLLELDLQEAEAVLAEAKAELDELANLGNAVSAQERRRKQSAVRHAELRLKRFQVLRNSLDRQQQAAGQPDQSLDPRTIPATTDTPATDELPTNVRLAEIDLREARLKLETLSREHARISELARQSTVPQSDLDRVNAERQLAELAVERAKIVLEGLKAPAKDSNRSR